MLFRSQYLGIKKYFPKIQFITNIWVAYTLVYCFLALTGGYYPEDSIFNASYMAMVYSLAVGGILLTFFICSYIRYRAGFGFALSLVFIVSGTRKMRAPSPVTALSNSHFSSLVFCLSATPTFFHALYAMGSVRIQYA